MKCLRTSFYLSQRAKKAYYLYNEIATYISNLADKKLKETIWKSRENK